MTVDLPAKCQFSRPIKILGPSPRVYEEKPSIDRTWPEVLVKVDQSRGVVWTDRPQMYLGSGLCRHVTCQLGRVAGSRRLAEGATFLCPAATF